MKKLLKGFYLFLSIALLAVVTLPNTVLAQDLDESDGFDRHFRTVYWELKFPDGTIIE